MAVELVTDLAVAVRVVIELALDLPFLLRVVMEMVITQLQLVVVALALLQALAGEVLETIQYLQQLPQQKAGVVVVEKAQALG